MALWLRIVLGLVGALVLFLAFVSTHESKFNYERSGVIQAPPEKIFPLISNFRNGHLWSPYETKEPNMPRKFIGPDGAVGSIMEFDSQQGGGTGQLEMTKVVPNESVEFWLVMTKPMKVKHMIAYRLKPEPDGGTRFTWVMWGDGGFLGKLMATLFDCEAMVAKDMLQGISNLKTYVESH